MKVFVIKGKKSKPAWPCVEKPLPLNLIAGWATLSSNNCNQAFVISGNGSFTNGEAFWRNPFAELL